MIELTNKLYSVTLHFPKKGPLRYKMRDLGTDILAHLIVLFENKNNPELSKDSRKKLIFKVKNDLSMLDSYFEVAKNQNWVSPKEILEIKNQYCKIREVFEEFAELRDRRTPREEEKAVFELPLKERQRKILEILKKGKKAQVHEFEEYFPKTSKRTLRRDLKELVEQGLVKRVGEQRDTFYQVKK